MKFSKETAATEKAASGSARRMKAASSPGRAAAGPSIRASIRAAATRRSARATFPLQMANAVVPGS